MLDAIFGWYCREALGCRFASVRFEETISPDSDLGLLIGDALNGAQQKEKLNGYNFIMLDMYSYTTPGIVKCRISPDNDTQKSFYIDAYEPARTTFSPPKLVSVDMAIDYTNSETQSNNVYLSFQGFWIPEDHMADFSMVAELLSEGVYTLGKLGESAIGKMDETNQLLRILASAQGIDVGGVSVGGVSYNALREPESICRRRR